MNKKRKTLADYPKLLKEYDYDKNEDRDPTSLLATSSDKVWWKCIPYGHPFESRISDRTYKHSKCPYCSNRKILPGFNDFKTRYPNLAKQWAAELNDVKVNEIFPTTNDSYWFYCTICGTPFERNVSQITRSGLCMCRTCTFEQSGKKLRTTSVKQNGSLADRDPNLSKEWYQPWNGSITPNDVALNSTYEAGWKCPNCNLIYRQTVNRRANGCGCPECRKKTHSSISQHIIYLVMKEFYPDTILCHHFEWLKYKNGYQGEVDIYIPELYLAIEYDGEYWHDSTTSRDSEKTKILIDHNITIVRFRDETLTDIKDGSYVINVSRKGSINSERLIEPVNSLITLINQKYDSNLKTLTSLEKYRNEAILWKGTGRNQTLDEKDSVVASEFDLDLNYPLTPKDIVASSSEKYWWKCKKCGKIWSASPGNRTGGRPSGCPNCVRTNARKVFCVETGETFPSVKDAAKAYNVHPQNISKACKSGTTSSSNHWQYMDVSEKRTGK